MAKKEDQAPLITVRVLAAALCEGGVTYTKGQTFETTAERADALGNVVTTKPAEEE